MAEPTTTSPNAPTAAEQCQICGEKRNEHFKGHMFVAPTAAEREDGSTPIRRAIGEVLQAAALHMIASPECAQAVERAVELHLAARRENERAIEAWSRTEGERLKLEQEVRDLRTAADDDWAAALRALHAAQSDLAAARDRLPHRRASDAATPEGA